MPATTLLLLATERQRYQNPHYERTMVTEVSNVIDNVVFKL
jgi:hypothetical protein